MKNNSERKLIYPPDNFLFDTHTDVQNEFIEKIETLGIDDAIKWLKSIKSCELSHPETLTFQWEGDRGDVFELSQYADFSVSEKVECDKSLCKIGNFKIGTQYFWRVNGGIVRSFHTKDNRFRFIKIDGVLNVRDIGGINIKQGMVYRGSDIYSNYLITAEGKEVFCKDLCIKTEIELRHDADVRSKSAAGENVLFKHFPYKAYEMVFEDEWKKAIVPIMEFLSYEENYPLYIHCLGGADRTEMIVMYLRALCEEKDDDIHLDYELTSLSTYAYGLAEGAASDGFRRRDSVYYDKEFVKVLENYAPGSGLSGQLRLFLKDCGVTDECMDKIVKILKR